jgi:hypothetical protein
VEWSGADDGAVRDRARDRLRVGRLKPDVPNAADQPAFPLIQNALYFEGLKPTLGPSTLAALDKAISPQDWNTLFLSSPEFMH